MENKQKKGQYIQVASNITMTRNEYIQLIFKNKPIRKTYLIDLPSKTIKKRILHIINQDYDISITKPPKKRFYGDFNQKDEFQVHIKSSIWRYNDTVHKNIFAKIKVENENRPTKLIVDYTRTDYIKSTMIWTLVMILVVVSILIYNRADLFSMIFIFIFFGFIIVILAVSTFNGINRQIKYYEEHLIEKNTTGNSVS